jgi:predicted extracellular nuclease
VQVLEDGGLTSLVGTLPAEEQYSISFLGEGQGIDQLVVSPALVDRLVPESVDIVHVNSEFPESASDHDPVVARFALG